MVQKSRKSTQPNLMPSIVPSHARMLIQHTSFKPLLHYRHWCFIHRAKACTGLRITTAVKPEQKRKLLDSLLDVMHKICREAPNRDSMVRTILQENLVATVAQSLHDRRECEPLRNFITGAQTLPKLCARQLLNLDSFALGLRLCGITSLVAFLLTHIDHVWIIHHCHVKICCMFFAHLLSFKSTIEVVAGQSALGARHVSTNDEVCGAKIFSNDHMLDSFSGACHLHRIWQISPPEGITSPLLIIRFLLHDLVGLDASRSINVARLCRTTSRVHKNNRILDILLCMHQQFEVGFMDGVTILESHDWLACRKSSPNICRSPETRTPDRIKALDKTVNTSSCIVLAETGKQLGNGRVLSRCCAIASLGFLYLIWLPHFFSIQHCHLCPFVGQENLLALYGRIGHIQDDGQPKNRTSLCCFHAINYALVILLGHEAPEG